MPTAREGLNCCEAASPLAKACVRLDWIADSLIRVINEQHCKRLSQLIMLPWSLQDALKQAQFAAHVSHQPVKLIRQLRYSKGVGESSQFVFCVLELDSSLQTVQPKTEGR